MDTLITFETLYDELKATHRETIERISPLIEEYLFCILTIRKLKKIEDEDPEQITILENIMKQDRKRIDDLLNLGIDPVYPGR